MKDYWGNNAVDFGTSDEMRAKYSKNIYVGVTDKPFGNVYVLYVCAPDENEQAEKFLKSYKDNLKQKGVEVYAAGILMGNSVYAEQLEGFLGGAVAL